MSEQDSSGQDPSGDPGGTGPRDPKAEAAAAKAYAKAQRPWYRKKRWILSLGFLLLIIVAAAAGGGEDSSNTASDSPSSTPPVAETPAQEPKPESPPASSAPTDKLPLQDGDWRLDTIRVKDDGLGDFSASARVTYTGSSPEGGSNLFTVTVFVGGENVASLQGSANSVKPGDAVTVDMFSTDPFVGGPYKYDFQNDI